MILARLQEYDVFADVTSPEAAEVVVDLFQGGNANRYSVQAVYDVQAPSAKTFDSGKQAVLVNQGVTYTANDRGVAGNSITVTLVDPGTDSALIIDVVGTDISVTLAYALAAITTTATELVAALNLDADVAALIAATGAGASPLTALTETPLATGADSEVSVAESEFTIPSHGFTTGLKVRGTTTGSLPDPLQLATDYFVIVVDANTIKLAETLDEALAGTEVVLVDEGSNGAVNTLTAVALAGATFLVQKSNNQVTWIDVASATSITVDGSVIVADTAVAYRYLKIVKTLTAGLVAMTADLLVLGETT